MAHTECARRTPYCYHARTARYIATTEHNPARWLPLEAIADAKFSHKSDVFGYGVVLWELLRCTFGVAARLGFPYYSGQLNPVLTEHYPLPNPDLSYGQTPWGAFGLADMTDALRAGERLHKPGLHPGGPASQLVARACLPVCARLHARARARAGK